MLSERVQLDAPHRAHARHACAGVATSDARTCTRKPLAPTRCDDRICAPSPSSAGAEARLLLRHAPACARCAAGEAKLPLALSFAR